MVTRPLLKDALREIRATLSRFIAILVIIFIGTAFFIGIKSTGPDMRATADRYYRESAFMDFSLLSTVGFSSDDIAAIRAVSGVRAAMPAYSVDAVTTVSGRDSVIRVLSVPDDTSGANPNFLNRPHLVSGRLPAQAGECVIEREGVIPADQAIGAHIALRSGNETDLADSLAVTEFTVVGIVESPLYISRERGTTTLGTGTIAGYMLVPDSAFKLAYHTAVYVAADLEPSATAYSQAYADQIARVDAALTAVADQRQTERQSEIATEASSQIADKEAEYNAAAAETRSRLARTETQLEQGRQGLAAGQAQYQQQQQSFQQQMASGQAKLAASRDELAQGEQSYSDKLAALQASGVSATDAKAQLAPLRNQLDASAAALASGEQQLAAQQQQGEQALAAARAKLEATADQLAAGEKAYQAGRAKAEKELASGAAQLADARAKLADLPAVTWYVLGRDTNSGYVEYENATERMDAIALVFPVVFVLVAILICFTSMSRMVEEQRGFIGTAKALGYGRGAVAAKFLLYGALAAVVGCTAGIAVGFAFMPATIFKAYSMLYTLPKFVRVFDVPFALVALAVSLAVTCLSALLVCYGELQSHAARLLRPRAPEAGKRIWLERLGFIWRRLDFTQKVTARNLIRYRSRFFMTVVGVAGCTALLLVGLGLNDALRDIGGKQFGEIDAYQMSVALKADPAPADSAALTQAIAAQPGFAGSEEFMTHSVTIAANGQEKSCGLIVPADTARLSEFVRLRDRVTGVAVPLGDDGVVLTEKMAAMLGVRAGDALEIQNGSKWLTTNVTGICETYLLHYLYMSPGLYEQLYGEPPVFNQINVRLTTPVTAQRDTAKAILPLAGVAGVNLIADSLAHFSDIIDSIATVFVILTIAAAALSFTVLYTLTTININERLREIATIKVLGFYDSEVSGFVLRENIVLALIGAAVGLVFGTWLAHYVIGTAEVEMVMFGRQIHPLSYVVAGALTMAFTGLVNLVMLRPLARIDMIEALKTVE